MPSLTTPYTGESLVNRASQFKSPFSISFPLELDDTIDKALEYNQSRPFMHFGTRKADVNIYLPIPEGLSFADGAEFSSVNLGVIGNAVSEFVESIREEGIIDAGKKAIQGEFTPKGSKIGQIALSQFLSQSELGQAALFANKRILNPNTNTTFTGVTLRNFSFTFKLVGRSPEDSQRIRDIHETFRFYAYPESDGSDNNIVLNYPEIWTIKFFDTATDAKSSGGGNRGVKENEFIPKIYESYLTGMTTNLNSSSSMFRRDGAPVEVDFTLNFQETRTLIREDFSYRAESRRGPLGLNNNISFNNMNAANR
jgi:hypothetical protein